MPEFLNAAAGPMSELGRVRLCLNQFVQSNAYNAWGLL
jgi:hypothetical protein